MLNSRYQEIPDNLKGHSIPNDFDGFVSGVYSNMVCCIGSKAHDRDITSSLIHEYILYMLGSDVSGEARYRQYDVKKYPDISYYKWFFLKLNYYVLKNLKKFFKEHSMFESLENCHVCCYAQWHSNPDFIFEIKEAVSFLEKYSNSSNTLFGKNAHILFIFKMEGYSNSDIAFLLDVGNSTITKWMDKLKELLRNYIDFDKNMIKSL